MAGKRSQVTIFMIMGITTLLMVGIFFFIKSSSMPGVREKTEFLLKEFKEPAAFQSHIELCMRQEAKQLIQKIALGGGTLSYSPGRKYYNVSYSYLCTNSEEHGCVNIIRTRKTMEDELKKEMLGRLPYCIDMASFRGLGFEVEEGKMDMEVTIGSETIGVNLYYPLRVSKGEFNFQETNFSVILNTNLGKLYDLAIAILNSEIENEKFDKDEWMRLNGADVEIDKHRPYPDITYSLRKYDPKTNELLTFNFALGGEDTIIRADLPSPKGTILGYCYTERDNNCYANSNEDECNAKEGEFSAGRPAKCEGISEYNEGCKDEKCKGCGEHMHGETWCEYDAVIGTGLDYVGSRHYLRSCFDGRIYYEECRDYREEICVEDGGRATCRQNRWQDCVLQHDRASCENSAERDCFWNDALKKSYNKMYENNRCAPIVPPGFKHWERNGFKVCQMANEQNDCDGIKCPYSWTDSTARYCYSMGDCGNYRNIADQLATGGYLNTHMAINKKLPHQTIYPEEGLTSKGQNYALQLKADVPYKNFDISDPYANPENNLKMLLTRTVEYLQETTKWSKDDFVMQYLFEGEVDYWTRHSAYCDVWNAPSSPPEGKCSKFCNAFNTENKPCTEYRCKSLSSSCLYEEKDGYGICFNAYANDKKAPHIEFDNESLSKNFTYEPDSLWDLEGVKIKPGIIPYNIIKFGVKTDEDSQCKLSFFPMLAYNIIPWPASNFSREHQWAYRVPDLVQAMDYIKESWKVYSFIKLSTLDEITALVEKAKKNIRKTASEFGVDSSSIIQEIDKWQQKYDETLKPKIKAFLEVLQRFIEILMSEIESHNHFIFIKCIDRAGNENKYDYFVKVEIKEDNEAPQLIDYKTQVKEGKAKVKFRINENAECRFSADEDMDYDLMLGTAKCSGDFDDTEKWNYNCELETPFSPPQTTVYAKCKDNPPKISKLSAHFVKSDTTSIVSARYANMIKINESRINVTSSYALTPNDTVIATSYPSMNLMINFGRVMSCRFGNEQKDNMEQYPMQMDCAGYICEKNLDIDKNMSIYISCGRTATISNRNTNKQSMVFEVKG